MINNYSFQTSSHLCFRVIYVVGLNYLQLLYDKNFMASSLESNHALATSLYV